MSTAHAGLMLAACLHEARRLRLGCTPTQCYLQVPIFRQCDTDNQMCTHLACGDHNTVVLTRAGRVLVAGDNSHGQCGLPNAEPPRCATFQVNCLPSSPVLDHMSGLSIRTRLVRVVLATKGAVRAVEHNIRSCLQ